MFFATFFNFFSFFRLVFVSVSELFFCCPENIVEHYAKRYPVPPTLDESREWNANSVESYTLHSSELSGYVLRFPCRFIRPVSQPCLPIWRPMHSEQRWPKCHLRVPPELPQLRRPLQIETRLRYRWAGLQQPVRAQEELLHDQDEYQRQVRWLLW